MKRFLTIILALLCLGTMLPMAAMAAEPENREVIYLEDGSYLVITIEEIQTRAANTKSGTKRVSYYGNDGTAEWTAYLNGTFTYTGSSSTCTASSCGAAISVSSWSVSSKSATRSGNTAYGTVNMVRKVLGVVTDRETASLTLSCDANGTLS